MGTLTTHGAGSHYAQSQSQSTPPQHAPHALRNSAPPAPPWLVELLLAHARGASPHAGALFEVMVHRMYHSTHPSGKRSTLSGKGSEKRHL